MRKERQPYNDFWIYGDNRQWHYFGGQYCEEFIDFNRVDSYEVDPERYKKAYKEAR